MVAPDTLPAWFAIAAPLTATLALVVLKVRDFFTG